MGEPFSREGVGHAGADRLQTFGSDFGGMSRVGACEEDAVAIHINYGDLNTFSPTNKQPPTKRREFLGSVSHSRALRPSQGTGRTSCSRSPCTLPTRAVVVVPAFGVVGRSRPLQVRSACKRDCGLVSSTAKVTFIIMCTMIV